MISLEEQKKEMMANKVAWVSAIGAVAVGAASSWLLSGPSDNRALSTVGGPNDEQGAQARAIDKTATLRPPEPTTVVASAVPSLATKKTSNHELMAERRKNADEIRRQLAALGYGRHETHTTPASAASPNRMPSPAGSGNQSRNALGKYIHAVVREQFHPVAGSCYEQLLERNPAAEGDVVLGLSIVGDDAVGGVVEAVEVRKEGTTLTDAEFLTCVSESMYTTTFAAPPDGQTSLTVTYPFSFAP